MSKLKKRLQGKQKVTLPRTGDAKIDAVLDSFKPQDLTLAQVTDVQLKMVQEVLKRMVELRLAQFLDSVLWTLKEQFEFDEGQLAQFARSFRRRMDGEIETPAPTNNNGRDG